MEKTCREKCGYIGKHRYHISNHKNMSGGSNVSKPSVYLFKADFCGHCANFIPTWDKLQQKYKGKNVDFITYDSDKHGDMMQKYNIMGFPTIMMETNKNGLVEFDDMRTIDKLSKFIDPNL